MRRFTICAFIGFCLAVTLCGCSEPAAPQADVPVSPAAVTAVPEPTDIPTPSEEENAMLQLLIGETAVTVDWEDNESVAALRELCGEEPLTISLSMYGGFEQVGALGASLPRSDVQTTTEAGDIVLYAGNQIVVFYGSNTWAYTRLGHISDQSAEQLARLLDHGDVSITLRAGPGR